MEHCFRGPRFSVGVEEELMIVDARSHDLVNGVELLLSHGSEQNVKPELLASVIEISTDRCDGIPQLAQQLGALRSEVQARAAAHGLALGSAGTHPWALWEDQRVVARERYEGLVEALAIVVRQELLFGLHVHVGLDDPEAAIAVANGLRLYVPPLLALSANSPFWRGEASGLMSTRMPIFRQIPRVGIPPYYDGWDGFQERIEFMVKSGVIDDYSYLWFDVRPHPKLGTVEIRAMDAQTRAADTVALTALSQALVKQLYDRHMAGERMPQYPAELLDENKWLAARYGLDAELVDLPAAQRVSARDAIRRELPTLREHAEELGSRAQLDAVEEMLERGNGAERQLAAFSAGATLQGVMAQIVAQTAPG
jgi:carboxylate-amine ligase